MEHHKLGMWVGGNVKVHDDTYYKPYRAMDMMEILEMQMNPSCDIHQRQLLDNILVAVVEYDRIADKIFK